MKAAIIDMDGTILDSLGMWSEIDRGFLEHRRGIPVPSDYVGKIAHMSARETAEYTIARFGLSDTPEELMAEWDEMALNEYRCNIPLKPWAAQFLSRLKRSGIKTILCTSSPDAYYAPALKRLGVYNMFDGFVTAKEAGRGKAFPDIYLLAAEKAGAEPCCCVAFEDIPAAVMGAKKAGMKTCGVYDPRSAGEMEHMKQICDRYIMNLKEYFNEIQEMKL